jgi:amino acid adenylation domain-containing protein/FkbH-like protein
MVSRLIDELKIRRVQLWIDSGNIRYKAPKGAMTEELRNTLVKYKTDIIEFLEDRKHVETKNHPLSYNQQSIWFMHQIAPESSCYTIAAACKVVSPMDRDSMERAIQSLVDRHPILRSVYTNSADQNDHRIFQVENHNLRYKIRLIDAINWPENELKARVEKYYSEPYDLSSEPVLRVYLFQRGPEEYIFMLTVHHIACDAFSLEIVLNDLFLLYQAELAGCTVELPSIDAEYHDFTAWQKDMLDEDSGRRLKSYWMDRLSGVLPLLKLPEDYKRPSVPSYKGGSFHFTIDKKIYSSITDYCHDASITKYVFLLSVFQLFLKKYGHNDDVLVGTPVVGRSRKQFMKTCGNFINTVVMRGGLKDDQTFRQHLQNTKQTVFTAIDHQDYPFSRLVEELAPVRDYSRTPVFQAMFNLLDQKVLGISSMFLQGAELEEPADLFGLKILPFEIDQEEGQFDLTLEVIDASDRFSCVLKYNSDVFSEETVDGFANALKTYISMVLETPEIRLGDFTGPSFDNDTKAICIGATFTAEVLEGPMEFWIETLGLKYSVTFAPYSQVFQELLMPESQFRRNSDGVNVLLIRLEDWWDDEIENPHGDLLQKTAEFYQAVETFSSSSKTPVLVCFCPTSVRQSSNEELNNAEKNLILQLEGLGNIYPVSSQEILSTIAVVEYDEPLGIDAGHVPYTDAFFASLSYLISRKIFSITGKPYKAIVLDCDQTLWEGVAGEDGPTGVKIDPARKLLQELMVEKHHSGTLICLCSKNIEQDVFEVFDKNPDMILKREHIAFSRINWSQKSQNLRDLAKEINIGLDSFIFIDDNPVECAEVRAECPEILTLQMPVEPDKIERFVRHTWAFDHLKLTKEDRERADLYRKETERTSLLKSSLSFEDFINSLGLKITISRMRDDQIPRVSQLTLRTNQFNFTTIRRNESEIRDLGQSEKHSCLVAEVTDRFGDYGLVGLLIYEVKERHIEIDTFLLSCRAMGRGVEHVLLQHVGKDAFSRGLDSVVVNYVPTPKNLPALNFIQTVGVACQEQEGGARIYKLPAMTAAEVTFTPTRAEREDDVALTVVDKKSNRISRLSDSEMLKNIAENLSDIQGILGSLDVWGKRFRSSVRRSHIQPVSYTTSSTEKEVAALWAEVLGHDTIGEDDNFFDLGGRSILMPRIVIRLSKMYGMKISIVDMFQHPTVRMMSEYIDKVRRADRSDIGKVHVRSVAERTVNGIAIIGMAGRFPGAPNVEQFWNNLIEGVESIRTFSDDELIQAGVPENLLKNPDYVKRCPVLDGSDLFDPGFFGYTPREAEKIDPQQRIFLECSWDAFEDAGYVPGQIDAAVGVFAGCGMNNYMLKNVLAQPELLENILNFQTFIGNDKDFLTTRVSYKLGLTGPSLSVQTACSTSLTAVQLACQSLQSGQCDMALAGGVSLQTPRLRGYLYNEGEIFSNDGYCRPFSDDANGTILGEGVGIVLLKRLDDAVSDNDHIYAVIKGAALNNDGSLKAGYTAPSVQGQAEVIALSHHISSVDPETIGYVEAHGTGTPIGDPIEVAALTKAFRQKTDKKNFCAIGSLKSNIGHLDVAAGVAGLIKTTLMVHHGLIPPSLNVKDVNPELNISESPFYVNVGLNKWNQSPRRAGVSSFGVGGTNAHVILEEYIEKKPDNVSDSNWHLLVLSARTPDALQQREALLADFLKKNPDKNIRSVAYTLQCGRKVFKHRSAFVVKSLDDAASVLAGNLPSRRISGASTQENRPVAFMFTGQGSQYIGMAKGLYESQKAFRENFDNCSSILESLIGFDLRNLLFEGDPEKDSRRLNETQIAQPALFSVEYSLAGMIMQLSVKPAAMIGHSLGEYVAACLAGVFSLEDALRLVATRGRLMQSQPAGDMLAVSLSEKDLLNYIEPPLEIAVVNAPERCVVSGPSDAVEKLQDIFKKEGDGKKIQCTKLHTSHAFHSQLMDGAVEPLRKVVETLTLSKPSIPFVSNVTGTWIKDSEATDPEYWARHLRQAVRFSDGIKTLLADDFVLIEVGPGQTLASLTRQNFTEKDSGRAIVATLRHPQSLDEDEAFFLNSIGRMWVSGVTVDWNEMSSGTTYRRTSLPGYPFERQRFWINPTASYLHTGVIDQTPGREEQSAVLYARPSTVTSDYEVAVDEFENKLTGIWRDVLGINTIGVHDNFFELGGDSLIAAQIISRIRKEWACELEIRALFESPTIRKLSEILKNSELTKIRKEECGITPMPAGQERELSLAQQRLWFLNQLEPHSPAYNIVQAVWLNGPLDVDILQLSLDSVLQRHDSLRTVFKKVSGVPHIEVRDFKQISIQNVDFGYTGSAHLEQEARRYIAGIAPDLFDLETGPLLRAYLFKIETDKHLFAVVMHHIIGDGWSMGVWMEELSKLYNAFSHGKPSPLPELQIQYSDFASWQKKWLSGNSLENHEHYWLKQLDGELPVIQLSADYQRPVEPNYAGRHQSIELSIDLSRQVKQLAKQEGTTTYVILLSAYFMLLKKYSHQNDIIVGTPYANRDRLEIEPLIGFFINMLPIRSIIEDSFKVQDLIHNVHQRSIAALSHKDLPFERLVELLHPERTFTYHPIFQVMFAFQNFPMPSDPSAEVSFVPTVMDRGATEFELSLYMWEDAQKICGVFEYSTEIFSLETIERMVGHFTTLLQDMVGNASKPVNEIEILTDIEKQRMLVEWNSRRVDYPRDLCIHDLFDNEALNHPHGEALVHHDRRMTYGELKKRADHMACLLVQMGVRPDDLVGICMDRSVYMIVSMLAVLKAGGAYVPLDPTYPTDRVKFMIADSNSKLVVTQRKFESLFSDSTATLIYVDDFEEKPVDLDVVSPRTNVKSSNLAYVIYTSGSTGLPKGVAIEHRSPIALFAWAKTVFNNHELRGMLASTSICFDLSVFEIFLPLTTGGKIILAENALELPSLKAVSEVRLVNTVPSAINELWRTNSIPKNVTTINLAGEPLKQELVDKLYAVKSVERVYDLYGPSEDTTYSTWTLREKGGRSTIGRPIDNTSLYLVDQYRQPVPVGVPGEIYIGGDGLARGYLNRPELTDEKFVPDFMGNVAGAKLYRTGDLARFYPDGNICFIGRIDHQIKLRGFRIELGEIESVLARHDHVNQSVAMVREDNPGDQRLVAYIVTTGDYDEKESRLREYLRTKLPEYMIPQHIVVLSQLPMTSNGKIDRKKLPQPSGPVKTGFSDGGKMTELERRLLNIWKKILGLDHIDLTDNFFEIGGNSLLSVQIFSEIHSLTGVNLPLATIFKSPTVKDISKAIEDAGGKLKAPSVIEKILKTVFGITNPGNDDIPNEWKHLVTIKQGREGNKPPIFCMHAIGGNVLSYNALAEGLDDDQSVYGLQALGLDGLSEPYPTIEIMAERYIEEMKTVQPHGPYIVAGGSMGGLIAIEVAQKLKKAGEDIALLAMFDTFSPVYFNQATNFPGKPFYRRVLDGFNRLIEKKNDNNTWLTPLFELSKIFFRKVKFMVDINTCKFYHRIHKPIPHKLRYWYVEHRHWAPIFAYSPEKYQGDLTLFSESYENAIGIDLYKGWDHYVEGDISVIEIPAEHNKFMETPLLVDKFREHLKMILSKR